MSEIETALAAVSARAANYGLYLNYYEGDHRLSFATDKYRSAFGGLFKALADNLCPRAVDALADRLQIVGFALEEGDGAPLDEAMDIWQENRMDLRSGEIILEALMLGDSYAMVWPNDEPGDPLDKRPMIYPCSAFETYVAYSREKPGKRIWAAKYWQDEETGAYRMTLYYPDRIERYSTKEKQSTAPAKESAFEPYRGPDSNEPETVVNEWGEVPIFHFANNARRLGYAGQSELKHIIPLQDALNKAVADMLVAMEFSAYRQRWVTGLEEVRDPVTQEVINPFNPGADRVWSAPLEAKFGEFAQTDLGQFLNVQDSLRSEIARVSATPLHHFMLMTGSWPSGESLKTAEAPFIAKATDRQISFGNVWEDVIALALRMTGASHAHLTTVWKDAAPATMTPQAAPTAPGALPQEVSMPITVNNNGGQTNGR